MKIMKKVENIEIDLDIIADAFVRYLKKMPLSILALVVLFVIFTSLTNFRILSATNLSNIARQSSVLLVAAIGATFAILLGGIDLSVGSIMAVSGVFTAVLVVLGVNPILAILGGMIIGAGFGLVNGIIISRIGIPPVITTLAMMFVINGVNLAYTHGYPITGIADQTLFFRGISAGTILGIPYVFLLAFVFWVVSYILLRRTVLGRHIYAVGGNREAARISGINVTRTETVTYLFGGLFAGLAGVLLMARLSSGHPRMGEPYLLDSIAAVFVGGTAATGGSGGVLESLIGALIISTLNNGMQMLAIDPFLITLVKGVLILIALVVVITRTRSASNQ